MPTLLPAFSKRAGIDERKEMMRLVIDSVTVDKSRAQGRIWFAILSQTGARTEHVIIRNTANYDDLAHFARIEEMVRTLNAVGSLDRQIADALTAEGIMRRSAL